ncbi:dirigent protein 25-like [Oryza brachyantha]|uniref:dirigent protein 25-like n=1 Tax=Oryza brachyantha TaxID=4533 RepID=UPI001AD9A652|nr:dirigent protein 25-like [Oryza brachyantha]
MQAQTRARILAQAYTALALLLTMLNTAAAHRPASHKPLVHPHDSDQTMTLYTTAGATPAETVVPSSQHPIFTGHGPIGHHSGGWLHLLTQPGALQPGAAAVVDEQFHGKKEFGQPLAGKLRGVLVTGLGDNGVRIVAVTASFAGDGEEDSLRFFGVHRDDQKESHVAVVGGTGRYDGATGFAVVRAADAHETSRDGSSSGVLSFRVHLK